MKQSIIQITLIICSLFLGINAAQSQSSEREIGLRFANLDNFGLIYKKGLKENKFRRFRLGGSVAYSYAEEIAGSPTSGYNYFRLGGNIAIGTEYRVELAKRFNFVHGPEYMAGLGLSVSNNPANITNRQVYANLGFGYILGFQFFISKRLSLNVETIPALFVNVYANNSSYQINSNLGFNSDAVFFTLAYRFNRKKKKD